MFEFCEGEKAIEFKENIPNYVNKYLIKKLSRDFRQLN